MRIFIKVINGETITLVDDSDSVISVKKQIEEMEGIPVDQQRLIFEGRELDTGRYLSYYNVREDSSLHLSLDLKGGFSATMRIFVKVINGETITLVDDSDSVVSVKKQIEEMEGIPVDQQRLIFEGRELHTGRNLSYYNVREDSSLHLSLDLLGEFWYPEPELKILADGHFLYRKSLQTTMQIFVTAIDGETLTVQTAANTVDAVKQKIEETEGVPVELQRLIFEGKDLEDGRELAYYNVRDGSTLHLTMDLEGGRGYIYLNRRYLALRHRVLKQICRKCYGRLSPHATRCRKAKCGRTSDIRPKKVLFGYDRTMLEKDYQCFNTIW